MANKAATLLIYTDKLSPRLSYILDFIFKEQWQVGYRLVTDLNENPEQGLPILNYSRSEIIGAFRIAPANLLFEDYTSIQKVAVRKQGKCNTCTLMEHPALTSLLLAFTCCRDMKNTLRSVRMGTAGFPTLLPSLTKTIFFSFR